MGNQNVKKPTTETSITITSSTMVSSSRTLFTPMTEVKENRSYTKLLEYIKKGKEITKEKDEWKDCRKYLYFPLC